MEYGSSLFSRSPRGLLWTCRFNIGSKNIRLLGYSDPCMCRGSTFRALFPALLDKAHPICPVVTPPLVPSLETASTWSITSGDRRHGVGEKDPMSDVFSCGNESQGAREVEPPIDFQPSMTPECSRSRAQICHPIAVQQLVHLCMRHSVWFSTERNFVATM